MYIIERKDYIRLGRYRNEIVSVHGRGCAR